jgi:hypothetical protein
MNRLKFVVPAIVLLGGLVVPATLSGKAEYTKKEKKGCIVCHTKAGSKDLNSVGKCYGEKKTLAGCEAK